MADYFGPKLKEAVQAGRVPIAEIDDHVRRVLYAEFVSRVVDDPPQKSVVDVEAGLEIAQRVEEKSTVLLKNDNAVLPIDSKRVRRIAVIGGHADVGMISGGGSAQVDPPGGNAIKPLGEGATHWRDQIWFPTSPLKALKSKLPNARIDFDSGSDLRSAASVAKSADLAIVFAYQWQAEEEDLPSLSLPDNQDALIDQVAAANPRTIVVLETGTAVTMPWIGRVAGVVEAWYAGSAGHRALANVLVGGVNPTGKLAMTFPKSEIDLPRRVLAAPSAEEKKQGAHAITYAVHYDEGSKVGYKWYQAEHKQPLFAFGFGLSYTTYSYAGLRVDSKAKTVNFAVKNTGRRAGTEIAQVYLKLPKDVGEPFKRLAGWKRVTLAPGESKRVEVAIDSRVLQWFNEANESWNLAHGDYTVFVGDSSDNTPLTGTLVVKQ